MKISFVVPSIVLVISFTLFTQCSSDTRQDEPKPTVVSAEDSQKAKVERGAYLVNAIGCDDCHSPKIMGPQGPEVNMDVRLSGHPAQQPLAQITDSSILKDYALFAPALTAAVGPWGTSFAANLTPDESGIGTWTEGQFVKAIREGKLKGMDNTRPLLPPMPWFNYRNLSDEDLTSIFAYLKTLKPVKNVVPAPIAQES